MTDVTTVPKTHTLELRSGKKWVLHQLDAFDYVELEEGGLLATGPGKGMSPNAILRSLWIAARRSNPGLEFEEFARSISLQEISKDGGPMTEAVQFVWDMVPFTDSPKGGSTSSSSGASGSG